MGFFGIDTDTLERVEPRGKVISNKEIQFAVFAMKRTRCDITVKALTVHTLDSSSQ